MECRHGLVESECVYCTPAPPSTDTGTVHLPTPARKSTRGTLRYWSPEEDAFARDLSFDDEEIADLFGRTPMAVHLYRLARGYVAKKWTRNVAQVPRGMARWTEEEVQYVNGRIAEKAPIAQIALEVGRSVDAVERKIARD